jgi:molybdopterin molybdotransferase
MVDRVESQKECVEPRDNEIDEGTHYIGYRKALDLVCSHIRPVGIEERPLGSCVDHVLSEDIAAVVNYPSADVSLKDGFAARSEDVMTASADRPVCLRLTGSVSAGSECGRYVMPGDTVKICSGAPLPRGADAVVSGEFCQEMGQDEVCIRANAEPGRNVLLLGQEIKTGAVIARHGDVLRPGCLGLAAAAGINRIKVYRWPRAAVLGVGDEVVAPGEYLCAGQLYASNLVTTGAWLSSFGVAYVSCVVTDDKSAIRAKLLEHLQGADTVLTSGGAWGSDRDLVVAVLDEIGWEKIFHRVRMGPGKGIAFGLWQGKPVFCLPGGPASNEMAFLQLALPGIFRMAGRETNPFPTLYARLSEPLRARHRAWTEFKDAKLTSHAEGQYTVTPYKHRSRLESIASADCLICIPEGVESLNAGEIIPVQNLLPHASGARII